MAWLVRRAYGCSRVQVECCDGKAEGIGRVYNPFPILLFLKIPELILTTHRVGSSENLDPQGSFCLFCLLFAFWAFDWSLSLYLLPCIPLERINAVHAWYYLGSVAFKPHQCQMSLQNLRWMTGIPLAVAQNTPQVQARGAPAPESWVQQHWEATAAIDLWLDDGLIIMLNQSVQEMFRK